MDNEAESTTTTATTTTTSSTTEEDADVIDVDDSTLYNGQYERLDCIEMNGIPVLEDDANLTSIAFNILQQIGVCMYGSPLGLFPMYNLYPPICTQGLPDSS